MTAQPPATGRPAVFLDRDGVVNRSVVQDGKPRPPATVAELEILPGVVAACADLRAAGYVLVVVTNQPDVARGATARAVADAINDRCRALVPVDDLRVCYHDDADACDCRKPLPGMLHQAAAHWGIDLSRSFMVGDRWKDIEAGRRAGCRTILVDYGYAETGPVAADATVTSLAEAGALILRRAGEDP